MRKQLFPLLAGVCLFLTPVALRAQTGSQINAPVIGGKAVVSSPKNYRTPPPTPPPGAGVATPDAPEPSGQTSASDEKKEGDEETDQSEATFVPHWTGQLGINLSTMPTQQGQGQTTKDFTFTGTYNITESGHFASLGITGGQQIVEGANTNYGGLSLDGGLGLGGFYPSLSLAMQRGSSALISFYATLALNFQIFEPLTVGLTLGGGLESHEGPDPFFQNYGELDDRMWSGGLMVQFSPWNFLSFSLTGQQETGVTYQWQNLTHTGKVNFDSSDRMPSVTLGSDITFGKDFVLGLSVQVGQEYLMGTVYSPRQGKTLTYSTPTTSNFTGYTVGLMYNFQ